MSCMGKKLGLASARLAYHETMDLTTDLEVLFLMILRDSSNQSDQHSKFDLVLLVEIWTDAADQDLLARDGIIAFPEPLEFIDSFNAYLVVLGKLSLV